jgi:hypothetical protein
MLHIWVDKKMGVKPAREREREGKSWVELSWERKEERPTREKQSPSPSKVEVSKNHLY